ncbi:T9SS type B sorting domain-containing protein [Lutibacter holmesii]|uniref:T9SS type B sorting domain-containing protein n=1 Tax=Lutibacter holmesii TaxID=1137985 RepID=A0ABW3WL06_9FLAO
MSVSYGQREAGIWYFGHEAGLDFNSGSPVALTNGKMKTDEGCASISDREGNLLFYTDGKTVWNAKHQIMDGGTGLKGHFSSTQSAIIVPNPINPNIYYIFTVDEPNSNPKVFAEDGTNDGLNYTEVNMSLNGGLGAINATKKNIHLVTYNKNNSEASFYKCSEKITAIQHADGNSFWVITHFINNFYAFKVTGAGVEETPQISNTATEAPLGGYKLNALGYLKSSPNGKKIAIVHNATRKINEDPKENRPILNTGKVLLYDFNSATGAISNPTSVLSGANPYGLAFSARSKRMYVSSNIYNSNDIIEGSNLYQFDLESSSIAKSKTLIKQNNYIAGALQLAIDEKIYRAGYPAVFGGGESESLSVINSPEKLGTACNFKENVFDLAGKKAVKGLPPFIQSLFLFSFKYEFTCLGDATHFYISSFETIDSVLWDFGDGTTSTEIDTYHTYKNIGTHTVTLTKTVNGEVKEPITKEIIISNKPTVLASTYQIMQCDSYDSNPNDELGTFNLETSINALTLNKPNDFNVFFYENDTAAEADIYNENPLPIVYTNTTPNQLITAKISYKNASCYSLAKVELIANPSLLLPANNLIGCDIGEGFAEFNFTTKKDDIISNLNLPTTIDIFFYASEEDVFTDNKLPNTYISEEKTIYFRAVNNGVCYGSGNFNLNINYFPPLELNEELLICENHFPVEISATIPLNLQSKYSYVWSNGETTPSISIVNEQNISVTITDKISHCEKTKQYKIVKVTPPNIESVEILNDDVSATIRTRNNFENEYSLDNEGLFQPEPIFNSLTPGIHTVFARNMFNCGISSHEFYVLGFPKFFTPNNDGFNDTWNILGVNSNFYQSGITTIFDRFGKFITQISLNEKGWNGNFNGEMLPASDYWFKAELVDNTGKTTTKKGHFSLIR